MNNALIPTTINALMNANIGGIRIVAMMYPAFSSAGVSEGRFHELMALRVQMTRNIKNENLKVFEEITFFTTTGA